jgi:Tfp pilus assembly protein FimT
MGIGGFSEESSPNQPNGRTDSKVQFPGYRRNSGVSLLELVFVLVILASLVVLWAPNIPSAGSVTLRTQAERFANDLRAARFFAIATGKQLCVKVDNSGYGIYEVDPSLPSAQCSSTPWKDALTNQPVVFLLVNDVSFKTVTGPLATSPLVFGEFGKPSGAAAYELNAQGSSLRISVTAFTGHVAIGS